MRLIFQALFFTEPCSFRSICELILSWFVPAFSQAYQLSWLRVRVIHCWPEERYTVGVYPSCRQFFPICHSHWKWISLWRVANHPWQIIIQRFVLSSQTYQIFPFYQVSKILHTQPSSLMKWSNLDHCRLETFRNLWDECYWSEFKLLEQIILLYNSFNFAYGITIPQCTPC